MDTIYKAAVVGLGKIGSSYPSSDTPRTHIAAYKENKRISIVAGVDTDADARKAFSEKWNNDISVFTSVTDMLSKLKPDIISLCVQPSILPQIIEECRLSLPKFFFIEKPAFLYPDHVSRIKKAINNVPTAINYHRCWDPAHIRLFKKILTSENRIFAVHVIYNNGMFNYASHALALLLYHFGSVSKVRTIRKRIDNNSLDDPSLDFILGFDVGFDAFFQGFDGLPYDLLELKIITKSGIYSLKAAGCRRRIEIPKKNAFYPGYTQLVDASIPEQDSPVEGLPQAIENIVDFLDGKTNRLLSDLNLGLNVFEVLWRIKNA